MTFANEKAAVTLRNLRAPLRWDSQTGLVDLAGAVIQPGEYSSAAAAQKAGVRPGTLYFQTTVEMALLRKVTEVTPVTNNRYGRAVAVDHYGSLFAVGVQAGDAGAANAGSVLIYSIDFNGNITLDCTILSPDGGSGELGLFGYSVSMDAAGTTIVIGERYSGTTVINGGRVHIYSYNRATKVATLKSTVLSSFKVGTSLFNRAAISGDSNTLAVGNPAYKNHQGYVEVFDITDKSSPVSIGKIYGFADNSFDPQLSSFGMYLSLNYAGSDLVVSANGNYCDTITLFKTPTFSFTRQSSGKVEWLEQIPGQNLSGSIQQYPVALSSSGFLLVSGSQPDTGGELMINARVGEQMYPLLSQPYKEPLAQAVDAYAGSVAISGDGSRLIVGAHNDSTTKVNGGAVYVYNLHVTRDLKTMDEAGASASEVSTFVAAEGGVVVIDTLKLTTTLTGAGILFSNTGFSTKYTINGESTSTVDSSVESTVAVTTTLDSSASNVLNNADTKYLGNTIECLIINHTKNVAYSCKVVIGNATSKTFVNVTKV